MMRNKNRVKCQIWTRCVGYLRPIDTWNDGKVSEYNSRVVFTVE